VRLHHALATAPLLAFMLLGAAPPDPTPEQGPRIVGAAIAPSPIHPGDQFVVTVETSIDVVAVEAHVRGRTFHLEPVESGLFQSSGSVPKFARFFKGTYRVTFVGHCASGKTAEYERDVVLS
jgi:hypothetical protein